jgi:ribosomal protein L32
MSANFCSNCGEAIRENSHFCAKCGNQLMAGEVMEMKVSQAKGSKSNQLLRLKKLPVHFWFSVFAICTILDVAISSLDLALSVPCDYATFKWSYGTVMHGGWATCYSAFDGDILSGYGAKVYNGASLKAVEVLVILGCIFWATYLVRVYKKTAETKQNNPLW